MSSKEDEGGRNALLYELVALWGKVMSVWASAETEETVVEVPVDRTGGREERESRRKLITLIRSVERT
jgi:hypothetical protein